MRLSINLLLFSLFVVVQYGCRSYTYSKGGRVETKYLTHYINDNLQVGAALYGDLPIDFGSANKDSIMPKVSHTDKQALRKFGTGKSDQLLFSTKPRADHNHVIGLIRDPATVRLDEYKMVREGKIFFLLKTVKYKNRDAWEGLIRLDQNRFLSIIHYLSSKDAVGYIETLNTIMLHTAARIKDGEMTTPVFDVLDDSNNFFDEHGYLAPFNLAESRNNYTQKFDQNLLDQLLATYYSFCGDVELVSKSAAASMFFKKEDLDAKDLSPAAAAILKQTKAQQVVMFNTSHHLPQHAYFVGGMLDSLYKQGFTHLALEAVGDPANIMKTGFVNLDDGFYTKDPVMSNLIAKAKAIGFTIVNYESEADDREQGQAQNLADQIYKKNKDCRLVVLAGYGHIEETASPKKMAGHFKDLTGIDPFTIDQTRLMASVCQNLDAANKEEVFVYSGKALTPITDLMVWNNINMQDKPINAPLSSITQDIAVNVPDLSAENDSIAAFLIYNQANYLSDSTAVPLFVKIIPARKDIVQVKLAKGRYLVQCLGAYKRSLYRKELVVE
ncbi:MAG: hypothetical protein V4594_00055 [Bacteroidota bacterium]